jgi:TolB-like protein/tetratricopeptide (TPR) repeat protein
MSGTSSTGGSTIRFGVFDLDTRTRELRKHGIRLKLGNQAYCVLRALLDAPGEVVTRQQLKDSLWPGRTFLDFDAGINKSVSQIRTLLGDTGPSPRFVETLSKIGYRFIAPVSGHPRNETRPEAKIAVLPFENLTGDPALAYVADGLAEALTNSLGGVNGISVISRTSAKAAAQTGKGMQAIARDLHVTAVIEGSVMRFTRLRVAVRLIDVHADRVVWKGTYDCEPEDLLVLCDRLTNSLAVELQGSGASDVAPAKIAPNASAAYLIYLKGRYLWNKRTGPDLYRSVAEFKRAIAIDPEFSLAHAGLADAYVLLGILGLEPPHSAFRSARESAERALSLNDNMAETHTCLAEVRKDYDWDWSAAEMGFQRAIALNPNYSTAHHYYAQLLVSQTRFGEAIEHIEAARRADPLSPAVNAYVPYIYLAARQYGRALAEGLRAVELEPDSPVARWQFGRACLFSGDGDRAVAELAKASELAGGHSMWQATLSFALARSGDRSAAETILRHLTALAEKTYVSPYDLALCCAGLGKSHLALDHLEQAYRNRVMRIISIGDPELDGLHREPRFAALRRRLRLPPAPT